MMIRSMLTLLLLADLLLLHLALLFLLGLHLAIPLTLVLNRTLFHLPVHLTHIHYRGLNHRNHFHGRGRGLTKTRHIQYQSNHDHQVDKD